VYRFLEKVWKLKSKCQISNDKSNPNDKAQDKRIISLLNKTVKKVSEDIEVLKFNTAISALMILANEMDKQEEISVDDYKILILLLSPFAPFIAEELWSQLGHKESIFTEKWPEYDSEIIKDEEIDLIIQINGKVRDKIKISADISEEEAKKIAMESEKIKTFVGEKEIKKIIYVRGRLISIVI
jgi:leucyl-tRNA synthetase